MFWKMQAGMGDVVFAPLYQVLRRRGVAFRFFHRVTGLRLAADRRSIGAIDMARQVELVNPDVEYEPLEDVEGLPCWPAEPRWAQVRDADRVRGKNLESFWAPSPDAAALTLTAGRDFDRVIFGISLGAVPYLCRELIDASDRWRAMVGARRDRADAGLSGVAHRHDAGPRLALAALEHVELRRAVRHLRRHVASPGSRAVARRRAGGERRLFLQCAARAREPGRRARSRLRRHRRGRGEGQRHRVPSPLGAASLARVGRSRHRRVPLGAAGGGRCRPRRGALRLAVLARQRRPVRPLRPVPSRAPAAIASSPARRASTTWSSRETGPTAGSTPAASRPPSSPVAWPPTR